ncbi:hypothetical protein [Pseudofrankia inefficax]|uniref:Uncharacterized protein n=1 Tax=Pseudofrankia inefficax (strain DSM 45817 / CECT 9037 / DDB 130130 / EuI1c) TaxID=298654 RepID=E3J3Y7_PSEI1|nr:hypothetical protein [Pseudofrankia inefficax]ADP80620.1 hypothetical protein FraEuI1c_2587 [Pseudofrankia inefficax]
MGHWEDSSRDGENSAALGGGARHGEADTVEILRAEAPTGPRFDADLYDVDRPEVLDYWDGEVEARDDALAPHLANAAVVIPAATRFGGRHADAYRDDDPAHRRAMLVWRSAVATSAAFVLALIIVSVVTTVHHTGATADAGAALPDSVASSPASVPETAPAVAPTDQLPAGALPPAAGPTQAEVSAPPAVAAAAPGGAGTGPGGGPAPAQTQTQTRPSAGPVSAGPTAAPAGSAPRCGPVATVLFLFWTLLGLGPC